MATPIIETAYLATGLTTGTTYYFKVQAHNEIGFSDYSNIVIDLAAQEPDQPVEPTTIWSNADDTVTIAWTAPAANGAAIDSYTIWVKKSDDTWSTELANCDGSLE